MTRKEKAINYFKEGYNCSQSVVMAFDEVLSINAKELCKIASPFGGGISRMRETCGAVTGMVLVLGNLLGYDTPEMGEKKHELYKNIQEILKIFENKYGSLTCRNLLNLSIKHDDPKPSERDHSFFEKRPCPELIGGAAEILEQFLLQKGFKL
jgi:C_GCAxxG_C_C family probable redox protein